MYCENAHPTNGALLQFGLFIYVALSSYHKRQRKAISSCKKIVLLRASYVSYTVKRCKYEFLPHGMVDKHHNNGIMVKEKGVNTNFYRMKRKEPLI